MSTPPETQSTRQRLLDKSGRRYREIDVEGVGPVRIKNLTAREQIEVSDTIRDGASNLEVGITYVIHCVVGEDDQRAFSEDDRASLEDLDARVMASVFNEIREFCGLGIGVKEAAKN